MPKLPKVNFEVILFKDNMDLMAFFIHNELTQELKSNTIFFKNKYPEIENIDFSNMNKNQINAILQSKLLNSWQEDMKQAKQIINDFQSNWDLINDNVMLDLSNRLNIPWPENTFNIKAEVGIMYSCPRNISERMLYTPIDINNNQMRENIIHEICHFLYFEKWKELFNDYDESHYNNPNIIWYLSEALIDPLLNNEQLIKKP